MAGLLARARDAVFAYAGADSVQRTIAVDSAEWFAWLAEADHRSFQFESGIAGFTARKERKQRGGLYWVAYRRAQGKVYKTYLGRSDEITLARLQGAATLLAVRIEALGTPRIGSAPTTPIASTHERPATAPVAPVQSLFQLASPEWPSNFPPQHAAPDQSVIAAAPPQILATKLYIPPHVPRSCRAHD